VRIEAENVDDGQADHRRHLDTTETGFGAGDGLQALPDAAAAQESIVPHRAPRMAATGCQCKSCSRLTALQLPQQIGWTFRIAARPPANILAGVQRAVGRSC